MREQQHKPTPVPIPNPIPTPILIPAEEELQKREGEKPDPIAGKAPNLRTSLSMLRARSPAQPLLWVLLSLGTFQAWGKQTKSTWTNQPGSKVAKCDLRGGLG